MRFYVLDTFPKGNAETFMTEAKGSQQGDAPKCESCGDYVGSLQWLPPLRADLELCGKEFGDFAFAPGSDSFLVSSRFKEAYQGAYLAGLTGFDPVEIVKVTSRRKKLPARPPYFRVVPTRSRTYIDVVASEFEWLEPPACRECLSAPVVRWKRLLIDEGTWSGDDIFFARGLTGTVFATQRFKDLCDTHKITNAIFTPAESYAYDFYPGLTDPSELDAFRK